MIKEIINKYLKRNEKYLSSNDIKYKINGLILIKTSDEFFKLKQIMIKEVKDYCKNFGFKIDKIIFINFFDTDINDKDNGFKAMSDSSFNIIEINGKLIAQVFIGSYFNYK